MHSLTYTPNRNATSLGVQVCAAKQRFGQQQTAYTTVVQQYYNIYQCVTISYSI
jgi:hypothetical protein